MRPNMREVLKLAAKQEIRRLEGEDWSVPWQTLYALAKNGLLEESTRRNRVGRPFRAWAITDAGRQALLPREIFKVDRDEYLCRPIPDRRGDYTTNPAWSVDRLPIMDPDKVSLKWRRNAETQRVGAQDRRQAAARVSRSLKAA
jgi:DNA-binding PadR family transcriptional regulator